MPERNPPIDLSGYSLAQLAEAIAGRPGPPPVERWDPPFCGHSGMRIARDGTWYHEGRPITRPAMVRLFASVLRREADGRHMLVTPVEKLEIDVEHTPLRALQMSMEGQGEKRNVGLVLDTGEALIIGPDHLLKIVNCGTGPSPRVMVRNGLEAELARPIYYELAEAALAEGSQPPGIWSGGQFHKLEAAS